MKLPDFLGWGLFDRLRSQMDAPLAESFSPRLIVKNIDLPIAEQLRGRGIDVEFSDIRLLDDHTLEYKGHRVLLYIRDIRNFAHAARQNMPRFHIAFCKTLHDAQRDNRFERYVVANRDDGEFQVNVLGQGTEPRFARLQVCQNCLAKISWQGFSYRQASETRETVAKGFSLKTFFDVYPRDLHVLRPRYTSDSAPVNDYPFNWKEISDQVRQNAAYTCSTCTVHLDHADSKYLHVHHRNGQKNDCRSDNLEVLCIRCHADEPMHGHMKAMPLYGEFIEKYGI